MQIVILVTIILVCLSVPIMHVTVSVEIMQLEVSAGLMKVTVSALNMWVTIVIVFMQVGVSVAITQVVLSAVQCTTFYCKIQVIVSVIAMQVKHLINSFIFISRNRTLFHKIDRTTFKSILSSLHFTKSKITIQLQKLEAGIVYNLVKRVSQYFFFSRQDYKRWGLLGFLETKESEKKGGER